jgi:hypothetical protein
MKKIHRLLAPMSYVCLIISFLAMVIPFFFSGSAVAYNYYGVTYVAWPDMQQKLEIGLIIAGCSCIVSLFCSKFATNK